MTHPARHPSTSPPQQRGLFDIIADAAIDIMNEISLRSAARQSNQPETDMPGVGLYGMHGGVETHDYMTEPDTSRGGMHIVRDSEPTQPMRMLIGFSWAKPPASELNENEYRKISSLPDHKAIIQPGQWAAFVTQTQVLFRPEGLYIKAVWASPHPTGASPYDNLLVQDVKVGKNSQHPTANPIPAVVYNKMFEASEKLRLDLVQVSMTLTVSVINVSDHPIEVEVAMVGSSTV